MAKQTPMELKPKTVTVEALEAHSYNGENYDVGDTYELDEQLVDSLRIQGKAVRADRVQQAKTAAKAAKAQAEAAAKSAKATKGSRRSKTAVEPMTTATTRTARVSGARKASRRK
jgi:hypothetical protein